MTVCLLWLRRDLRLDDNPALVAALERHEVVIPLYVLEGGEGLSLQDGRASRWWLHHSLVALGRELQKKGSRLLVRKGVALEALEQLIVETQADALYWNRLYTPQEMARDREIKQVLEKQGLEVWSFNASLLKEPWEHQKADGTPYRIFTPFWKSLKTSVSLLAPLESPERLPEIPAHLSGERAESFGLLPEILWDQGFYEHWTPGVEGAESRFEVFLDRAISGYDKGRDLPALSMTSGLSPHLRFGEISVRRVVLRVLELEHDECSEGAGTFLKELGWREFAHHLLFHFPNTCTAPLDERYQYFPYRTEFDEDLKRWQKGQTGYPIIDAGMRELWATGWMHNRVRMIVASFLTKNLLIPWQLGAQWFWDTLVDADLAANTMGWQWAQGCGADAAPYYRIFNPRLQGEKFDSDGEYTRRWVPELNNVPSAIIHRVFERPSHELRSFGVHPGENYPNPIVDLAQSRLRALEAYEVLRLGNVVLG